MPKVTTKYAKVKREKDRIEKDMADLKMMMKNMMAMSRLAKPRMKQQNRITKEKHKKGLSIQTANFFFI